MPLTYPILQGYQMQTDAYQLEIDFNGQFWSIGVIWKYGKCPNCNIIKLINSINTEKFNN